MNLLLLEASEIGPDNTSRVGGARARHLREVLRVQPGQEVRVGLVDGGVGTAVVVSLDGDAVALHCAFGDTPVRPRVDLLLALPRPKVMRRLWAQVAALGIGRILLTNAERVERQYFDTHVLAPDVYRPLLIEGLQQAKDTRVPIVSIHKRLKVLVEDDLDRVCPTEIRLVGHPGSTRTFRSAIGEQSVGESTQASRVLLAIGPEGGWTDYERRLLGAHQFVDVGMGDRTLRSDTACVALLALLHDALR